jgi:hypothetical protein
VSLKKDFPMSNPFAYYEENQPVKRTEIGFSETADTGEGTSHEPRVPIVLSLKRGLFGGKVTLEVTRDQCEISGDSLTEPIVVLREDAHDLMRMKNNKLIVRTEDGRKFSFRYGRDKQRELALARLETWHRQRWHDAGGRAYESVSELLKKNVIRPLLHNMIALTVLQSLVVLFIIIGAFVTMWGPGSEFILMMILVVLMYAVPPMVTFALAVALGLRQIWAVYMTMILSFVPLGLCVFTLIMSLFLNIQAAIATTLTMLIPTLLAVTIIASSIRVIIRYTSQQTTMEYDNRQPSPPTDRRLFDKDNRIAIVRGNNP